MLKDIRNMKYGEINEAEDKFVIAHQKMRLNEEEERKPNEYETANNAGYEDSDAVPYAKDDDVYTTSVESAKSGFSAKFPEKNPVLYYPSEDDVVMSGTIPAINAKFRFSHKDSTGQGCYIWVDSLQLTTEVLNILNKVLGVYKNWKDSLNKIDDLKPMSMEK